MVFVLFYCRFLWNNAFISLYDCRLAAGVLLYFRLYIRFLHFVKLTSRIRHNELSSSLVSIHLLAVVICCSLFFAKWLCVYAYVRVCGDWTWLSKMLFPWIYLPLIPPFMLWIVRSFIYPYTHPSIHTIYVLTLDYCTHTSIHGV